MAINKRIEWNKNLIQSTLLLISVNRFNFHLVSFKINFIMISSLDVTAVHT